MVERTLGGSRTPDEHPIAEPSETDGRLPIKRRELMASIGAVIAAPAAASGDARAADTLQQLSGDDGYGAGAYGDGPYGDPVDGGSEETLLAVETHAATDVDASSSTVNGELTALQGYDEGAVYFEWGESGTLSETTTAQTLTSTGTFDATLTGLKAGTAYEFRAVAETADATETGTTRTFTTESASSPDAVPRIVWLDAEDDSNPNNPHADASVAWEAVIDDGELDSAVLSVSDASREVLSWRYDLSGQSAVRFETERIHHGGGATYTVDLTVNSSHGTTESEQTTFQAQ